MSTPRRRKYTHEEAAPQLAAIGRRKPGRPVGPNHLESGESAHGFLLDSGIYTETICEAAVLAQRVALPFDELRTTDRAATLSSHLRKTLAALVALPDRFRRTGVQRDILAHIEGGVRGGLFYLGADPPQLVPENERGLEPSQIEALEFEVREAFNARKHTTIDDACNWYAAKMKAGKQKLLDTHREEAQAFYRSLRRCKPRVRFLVLLFHSAPSTINLEPIELAALALCVGLRNEKACADNRAARKRADVWGKAKKSAAVHHRHSPFTASREAWIARMNGAVDEAQRKGMSRSGPSTVKPGLRGRARITAES